MKFYIDDKMVEIENIDELYIGEGQEGIVYRYEDKDDECDYALKLYKEFSPKDRLNFETAKGLSEIETERLLLPRKLVYDENKNFIGYVTEFVNSYSIDSISYLNAKDLIDEIDILYSDVDLLSMHDVSVDDMILLNMLYDGRIILNDPGSYRFVTKDSRFLRDTNFVITNEFLNSLICRVVKLTRKEKKNLDNYFLLADSRVSDLMRCDVIEDETVKTFIKRITK